MIKSTHRGGLITPAQASWEIYESWGSNVSHKLAKNESDKSTTASSIKQTTSAEDFLNICHMNAEN